LTSIRSSPERRGQPTGAAAFRCWSGSGNAALNGGVGFLTSAKESTFKENRANRRPISFKDSTAFVSMGCFFVNSTQTGDIAKKRF
jgi:hypothetical protein